MERNTAGIVILVIVILAGFNVYQFLNKQNSVGNLGAISSPAPQQTNTPNTSVFAVPVAAIPVDWKSYSSIPLGFSIKYPSDMKTHPQHGGAVLFVKFGPTQVENAELYDGISLIFDVGDLNGETLQQVAQQKLTAFKNEPITEKISELEPATVGKYSGYKFLVRDLGERTYTYLPKGNNEYLVIIDSTVDPNNLGFGETINQMISTLDIH